MKIFNDSRKNAKVEALFDYQRFEGNSRLAKLIEKTENRYNSELDDDDLDFVNAAGDIDISNNLPHFRGEN
ncbi:MAG: hypothetical protein K5917_05415 [Clostridiales bacterium]|nr:hypothetical protein [Clostridiales bacterium]